MKTMDGEDALTTLIRNVKSRTTDQFFSGDKWKSLFPELSRDAYKNLLKQLKTGEVVYVSVIEEGFGEMLLPVDSKGKSIDGPVVEVQL